MNTPLQLPFYIYLYIVWPQPVNKISPTAGIYGCLSDCELTALRPFRAAINDVCMYVYIAMDISQWGSPAFTLEEEEQGNGGIQQQQQWLLCFLSEKYETICCTDNRTILSCRHL